MSCCCNEKVYTSNVFYDGAYLPVTGIVSEDNGNDILYKIEQALSTTGTTNIAPGNGISVSKVGSTFYITNTAPNVNQNITLLGNVLTLSNGGGTVTLPGAIPQVNSDWLATSGVAMILNKPIIPAPQTLSWDNTTRELTLSSANTVVIEGATYIAGTDISITGNAINNTAPNIVQALSISGNIISLSGGGGSVTLPVITGAETKVTGGTNITVTGSGTTSTPYVINATSTPYTPALSISGNDLTIAGGNTVVLPIPAPPDGSETKVIAGANTTVIGTGTTASPYVIGATPSLQTLSVSGNNLSISSGNTISVPNLYTGNGTLTADRTIFGSGYSLNITGLSGGGVYYDNYFGFSNLASYNTSAINSGSFVLNTGTTNTVNSTAGFATNLLTDNRHFELPDNSGTIPLSVNGVSSDNNGNIDLVIVDQLGLNSYDFSSPTDVNSKGIETNGGLATGSIIYRSSSFTVVPSTFNYVVIGSASLTITFPDPAEYLNSMVMFRFYTAGQINFAGGTVYHNDIKTSISMPDDRSVYMLVKAAFNASGNADVWEILDIHTVEENLLN